MFQMLYAAHPADARHPAHALAQASARPLDTPPGTVLVRVSGELDLDTVHVLRTALTAYQAQRTIVDLSRVTFADSSLFHTLHDHRDQRLVLTGPCTRQLAEVLALTGATDLFPLAPDSEAAQAM
ncbi:STAS domain-containing protein [Streptomyces sp. NPDC048352]|uniref:STAS domain-containing protein n=1 Tax=Streptomyces sp. NPDC048352 TaxID=3154718 RepID=UPI00343757BF